jgi:uncharacterized protein
MFTIHTLKPDDMNTVVKYYYDSHNSTLVDEYGNDIVKTTNSDKELNDTTAISKNNPGVKIDKPKKLKISLGLSCNYSCDYCSQRFVPHADSTSPDDIDAFIESLFKNIKEEPNVIEFWGGEPFVYWKTFKPLAERIKERWKTAEFKVITNGTLLDMEKIDWLDSMDFSVGVSHDGPGQNVRGDDPLFDPEKRKYIEVLVRRFKKKGKVSVNAMLNKQNTSRANIQQFLTSVFGNDIQIGEGSLIDSYDEGGHHNMMDTVDDHIEYRKLAFAEIRSGQAKNFIEVRSKIIDFITSIQTGRKSSVLGQKCGMDRDDNITVDLKGNVITCQNVSAEAVAHNGNSHKIGNLGSISDIRLNTVTHWKNKQKCVTCPVIQLCRGSCMFLEGPLWEESCNASYSDNIVFLFSAIEMLTGNIPIMITGEGLPEDRIDVFNLQNIKYETKKTKFIPIKTA